MFFEFVYLNDVMHSMFLLGYAVVGLFYVEGISDICRVVFGRFKIPVLAPEKPKADYDRFNSKIEVEQNIENDQKISKDSSKESVLE